MFFHFVWNANQIWRVERLQKNESRDEAHVSTKYSDIEDLADCEQVLEITYVLDYNFNTSNISPSIIPFHDMFKQKKKRKQKQKIHENLNCRFIMINTRPYSESQQEDSINTHTPVYLRILKWQCDTIIDYSSHFVDMITFEIV